MHWQEESSGGLFMQNGVSFEDIFLSYTIIDRVRNYQVLYELFSTTSIDLHALNSWLGRRLIGIRY